MRCAGAADVTARRGAAATRRALRVALARLLTSWKLLGPPVTSCDAPHAVEWQVERKGFPAKGLLLRGSLWGHCGVTAGPAPPMRPPAHLLTSSIRISHNSPFATMRSRPWNSLSLTNQSALRQPCAPGRGGMRYTDIDPGIRHNSADPPPPRPHTPWRPGHQMAEAALMEAGC